MNDFINALSEILPVLGIIAVLVVALNAVIFSTNKASIKKSPVLTRHGKVIEKTPVTYERVIVEFDDKTRANLVDLKHKNIFTVGDTGVFKTQKHIILSFERD